MYLSQSPDDLMRVTYQHLHELQVAAANERQARLARKTRPATRIVARLIGSITR